MDCFKLIRYQNRKYYGCGRYWNTTEIKDVIRKGSKIEVKNHRGFDITNEVLKAIYVRFYLEFNNQKYYDLILANYDS